jgi:hypothetical protein
MRFRFGSSPSRLTDRVLIYRPAEFSFDVEPELGGFTSVVVNELSLEIDEAGKIIKAWGYCPHLAWVKATIVPPRADLREVTVISDETFLRGVSQSVNADRRWPVLVDEKLGWVCLDSGNTATSFAEIFPGLALGLDEGQRLSAIYLKPKCLPQLH